MAITDITADAVLAAFAEFDRLGRERFLADHGFGASRRYRIRHGGRLYDSKAIAGFAHGRLLGREPLRPADFSGGVGHAVGVLRRLGFEVVDGEDPARTVDEVVAAIGALRPAPAAGGPMLKQGVVLLWAVGRARAGESRLLSWADTVEALTPFLAAHRRNGERREARADYPVAALFHACLWDLPGRTGEVPPAHGDAALKAWFTAQSPSGGLPSDVYEPARRSGQARIRIIEAVTARFFDGFDDSGVLAAVGLYDDDLAADEPSPSGEGSPDVSGGDATSDYTRLCEVVGRREAETAGRRRTRVAHEPIRLAAARRAVLLRSEGHCENPGCALPAPDVTDQGAPILQVDHIEQIADGGRDHPSQMIALCPNCHAVKTLGRSRHELVGDLTRAARERHERWLNPIG